MSANAEIILEEKKNVLLIPEGAVIFDKDKNAAWKLRTRRPAWPDEVAVKLGITNGVKAEVLPA